MPKVIQKSVPSSAAPICSTVRGMARMALLDDDGDDDDPERDSATSWLTQVRWGPVGGWFRPAAR